MEVERGMCLFLYQKKKIYSYTAVFFLSFFFSLPLLEISGSGFISMDYMYGQ